jgi:hypothetical protein
VATPFTPSPVTFIRGYNRLAYHAHIFDDFQNTELPLLIAAAGGSAVGFYMTCPGGGRIDHKAKNIFIYGYSQSFG